MYLNHDMMIIENEDKTLSLHHADVVMMNNGLIDFDLTAGKCLADLVFEDGKIKVKEK